MPPGSPGDHDTIDARSVGADPTTPASRLAPLPDPAITSQGSRWVIAGRYEVLSLLGAGGMGSVYRALDRELDEVVALKMVSARLASSGDALDRFKSEVKLARRVTHRNVARTFDIGEHAGARFLTMELVEGELLGALLARRGRLRFDEVIRIGHDLCAALGAAHEAGVLHRDLKPENVVIATDGRAVVTDFGIARALDAGASARSAHGVVVGTPAYMAPEQLEGLPDLDARVDIYALGTMLFELLAGILPWAGDSEARAMIARLREEPPDVRVHRPALSEAVAGVVRRCMARRREDRFESAAEVSRSLTELVGPLESGRSLIPPGPRELVRTKVAVLSLVNTGGRAHAYLAETLSEDLIDVLSGLPDLHVRPRAQTYRVDVPDRDSRAAGRALGVDAVIEGTLACEGDRMAVSLRLLTVEDGFQLWARRFDRAVTELASVANDAAAEIAAALTTKTAPRRALPTHPVAHDLYLRGRYSYLRGWYDSAGEAIDLLSQAHQLSPANAPFAATYARALARSYGVEGRGEDVARVAQEVAEKALALEPALAEARVALAMVHLYRGEGVASASELRRALASNPNDPSALELAGRVRLEVGPVETAAELLTAALEGEPTLNEARYSLARAWATIGRWDHAATTLGPTPTACREVVPFMLHRSRFLLWERNVDAIDAVARELPQLAALFGPAELRAVDALLTVGRHRTVSAREHEVLQTLFPTDAKITQRRAAFNAQIRAEVYLACRDFDAALRAILEADANGLIDLTWLERCPLLDEVRQHPTFSNVRRATEMRAARIRDALDDHR